MTGGPVRFAIVGTGWRTRFMLRLAAMAPEVLEPVAIVGRNPGRAHDALREARAAAAPFSAHLHDHLPVDGLEQALSLRPDFVVAAVPWEASPGVIREVVGAGVPVLAETPPAPDLDGLRSLWADVGSSGLVQVAEQYTRMPGHAARIALLERGVIGAPHTVEVSSTHLYHAVSLVRTMLGAGAPVTGAGVRVNARTFTAPMVDPLTPDGWVGRGAGEEAAAVPGGATAVPPAEPRTTTIATLDLGDGRFGLYDFVDNQWWNPYLHRRIVIRGSHGEIADDSVLRMTPDGPVAGRLEHRRTGVDLNLEGNALWHMSFDGDVVYRNAWHASRMSEDDLAVAQILLDTGRWARGEGPAPYPLAEGLWDHALSLAIVESAHSGADVVVADEPWA
ncbi:Gfo/Idh/MocA family oxidoreductase [Demequina rhizosphaerae]|uniref:Gfo/Idh/MocA family oxidoreductase n=1 Tax=Demequina rhizosphaerae TaxID=1638985 RepID=UPI0007826BE6|nr:Gfo/Idh/MocA family oxidoreductase [Demequina rhizosphaerae]